MLPIISIMEPMMPNNDRNRSESLVGLSGAGWAARGGRCWASSGGRIFEKRQPPAVVTDRYKAVPKSGRHARLSGTSHLRPAVWGTQLDQSSPLGPRANEMKGRSAGSSACQPGFGESILVSCVTPLRPSSAIEASQGSIRLASRCIALTSWTTSML